jgi:hypothetical protein
MDEKFTINLYGAIVVGDMRPAGTGADIAIVVDYQPWFIPIRRRQIFRFVTQHFADGSFRWSSYPMD